MAKNHLLTRDAFREGVFLRDGHACVFCHKTADQTPEGKLDAHHIVERRLFTAPDEKGGYFLNNGATVCEEHHLQCEKTLISVEEVRDACGIKSIVVPQHFYADQPIDKWGNPILPNGTRLRGELFYDESVQKVLAEVSHLFTHLVKYPRTHHMPWSPGIHSDDRVIPSLDPFQGERVVLTVKKDGENTSMYRDYFHARSLDSRHHASRNWVKNFWGSIQGDIPEHWRVCGENVFAQHSIPYSDLPSYFLGFSIWNDENVCLSWDDTLEWFALLGITPVEVVYDGVFDEAIIRRFCSELDTEREEGFVLRKAKAFSYGEFRTSMMKYVRQDHVQTIKHHWSAQPVIPNGLSK